ncbi:MAG: 4'-phosphopantetheinyl transferase [Oscillospiraceae bacterium]|nr:4'-phosphopantetheinyl transferase [Oscillospiraceae bacterium]
MPIELWAARLERPLTERETGLMLDMLPPERRERILRLKQPEKRREPLCAYLILRLALREQYHWRELPEIRLSPRGKPCFPEHPEVHFNLSHTSGAVLVGLSDQPLGVDIEKIRPVSRRAARRLAGVTDGEVFFQSWVRREARVKRGGAGIGTMLRQETPLESGEFYYPLDTFPGYAAGVATRSRDVPGAVRRYSLDEVL